MNIIITIWMTLWTLPNIDVWPYNTWMHCIDSEFLFSMGCFTSLVGESHTATPKDPGIPQINWMHRIILIEGDLNICLSEIFSWQLMLNAEKHNLIHKGQFRSQQGKMAISMALLKYVSYDIIQQTWMDACMFNNDATACYNHIIPSMAMLKCWCTGTPHPATNVVLKFLHCAKYHVHTTYGISVETFSNLIDYVLGLIQDTGHAGLGWALTTSSITFNQMETTHGAYFHAPHPAQNY